MKKELAAAHPFGARRLRAGYGPRCQPVGVGEGRGGHDFIAGWAQAFAQALGGGQANVTAANGLILLGFEAIALMCALLTPAYTLFLSRRSNTMQHLG